MVLSTALIYHEIDQQFGVSPKFSKITFRYPRRDHIEFEASAETNAGKRIINGSSTLDMNGRQQVTFSLL